MTSKEMQSTSKFISLILRHKPETIGLKLDEHGWIGVEPLIRGINGHNGNDKLTMDILEEIVATDSKQRYSFSPDKTLIRANQGHSIDVDLELKSVEPPNELYHGTSDRFRESILESGIKHMSRRYVHLSSDKATAKNVGTRHGRPIIIVVDSLQMYKDGVKFYISKNKVWLTDYIDPKYFKEILEV